MILIKFGWNVTSKNSNVTLLLTILRKSPFLRKYSDWLKLYRQNVAIIQDEINQN